MPAERSVPKAARNALASVQTHIDHSNKAVSARVVGNQRREGLSFSEGPNNRPLSTQQESCNLGSLHGNQKLGEILSLASMQRLQS